jgi:hypothetical protein
MKLQKWTLGLAAVGLVTLSPAVRAEDAPKLVPVETALSATTISGYVDTSMVWNPGTGNLNPAPYAFNAGKQDGFNVNAVDLKIAKAEGEDKWAAGYVLELSYGPDAIGIDGGAYPIRQAYVEMKMPIGNGLDWQLGRWDNLLGYESSDSYKNPNYTRSYAYSFEPTEHTGLLASYAVSSSVNIQAGVVDTVNTEPGNINQRSDPGAPVIESKKGLVSLVTLTAPDSWGALKGSTLVGGVDYGEGDSGAATITGINSKGAPTFGTGHDRQEVYIGATINTPVKDLTVGASWDWIHHVDVATFLGTVDVRYLNAVAGYASYKVDKLTLSGRAEYANGPGLAALLLANDFEGPGKAGSGGVFDKVAALTATVQYDLWANVITRLELRWDHACDTSTPFGGSLPGATTPGIGNKKNEVMIAANVIYKF